MEGIPTKKNSARCIASAIYELRNKKVVLAADLATFYGIETKRLNEAVKRNREKFNDYAFQLSHIEFAALRSQFATSNNGRGGARYLPWAFTEHGIVMAATVLNTDTAIKASRLIVEVFIAQRHHAQQGSGLALPIEPLAINQNANLASRIQLVLDHLLDSMIDSKRHSTVREEAQQVMSESLQSIKDHLQKQCYQNHELAAKASKCLAEAELARAGAAKTRAETNALELATLMKKLRLVLEAQRLLTTGNDQQFLKRLQELMPGAEK